MNKLSNPVIIHCKESARDLLTDLGLFYDEHNNELDVIVEDVEYLDGNHPSKNGIWEDPDIQLCEYYGINYNEVNCIEAA